MESHQDRADELLEEADRIQQPSDELKDEIDATRSDWEQKKSQEAVPGAIKPEEQIADENYEPPNTFEFEQRTPETAEAQGPGALGDPDSEDDDDSGEDS